MCVTGLAQASAAYRGEFLAWYTGRIVSWQARPDDLGSLSGEPGSLVGAVSAVSIRAPERAMSIPDQSPHHSPRAMAVKDALSDGLAEVNPAGTPHAAPAPASWPWRRAALLASIAAQMITIAALNGADPIPATWAALLLAIAPAPLALAAAFSPAPAARLAAPLAVVVLVAGIIGQVTHTGLFFLPALATMAVAALRLWHERA
jgi:hypothetical protein